MVQKQRKMYRPVKSKVHPNDRFIPRRISINVNINRDSEDLPMPHDYYVDKDTEFVNYAKVRYNHANYQRALREVLLPLDTRVLNFFSPKKYTSNQRSKFQETWPVKLRKKPVIGPPFTVLDMPHFDSDIRHQVADWSSNSCLATIFENELHMWCLESEFFRGSTHTGGRVQYSVKWRPNGTQIAAGLSPNKIGMFDMFKKKIIHETVCCFEASCRVYALEWVDNDCLVSGCKNGVLRVMSSNLEELKRPRMGHAGAIVNIKTSCNKKYIATSSLDKTVHIWKIPEFSGHFKVIFSEVVNALAWHPWKNGVLATGLSFKHGRVVIWNVDTKQQLASETTAYKDSSVDCLTFNPISGELVVSYHVHCENDGRNINIGIINVFSNIDEVVEELHMHNGPIPYLLWGHGGQFLASVSADENLCIWEFFGPSKNKSQTNKQAKKLTNQKHFGISLFGTSIR